VVSEERPRLTVDEIDEGAVGRQTAFMTVKEAAGVLDVSEMTVRRAFDSGGLPGIRFGRTCRVSRAFVHALLAEVEAGRQINVIQYAASWPAAVRLSGGSMPRQGSAGLGEQLVPAGVTAGADEQQLALLEVDPVEDEAC